jgi:hypothetical protein
MPILPGLCYTDENLEATVRWTAEHGGKFVLAGGLMLADQQRDYFFGVLRERFPDLVPLYERLCSAGSYGSVRSDDPHALGRRICDLCGQYGIADRMPRPIIPGDKRALNKRIGEALARGGQLSPHSHDDLLASDGGQQQPYCQTEGEGERT